MILSPTCLICSTAIDVVTFHAVSRHPDERPAVTVRTLVTCPRCGESQAITSATAWIPTPD